jgi:hypothetical protein
MLHLDQCLRQASKQAVEWAWPTAASVVLHPTCLAVIITCDDAHWCCNLPDALQCILLDDITGARVLVLVVDVLGRKVVLDNLAAAAAGEAAAVGIARADVCIDIVQAEAGHAQLLQREKAVIPDSACLSCSRTKGSVLFAAAVHAQ